MQKHLMNVTRAIEIVVRFDRKNKCGENKYFYRRISSRIVLAKFLIAVTKKMR